MNKFFIPFLAVVSIVLSSCNIATIPANSTTTPNVALSTVVTNTGVSILTTGAVEATVYHYLKKAPESLDTFTVVQDKLAEIMEDNIVTPNEIKSVIKAYLTEQKCEYRSYALIALDVIFNAYQTTANVEGYDVSAYKNMINATIVGIGDAIELYVATTSK